MRPYQLDQSQISARQPQPQVDRHLTRSSLSNPSYMFWNTFRTVLKHKHRAHDMLTVLSQTGSAPGCSGILHADTAMTWPRLSLRLTAAQRLTVPSTRSGCKKDVNQSSITKKELHYGSGNSIARDSTLSLHFHEARLPLPQHVDPSIQQYQHSQQQSTSEHTSAHYDAAGKYMGSS